MEFYSDKEAWNFPKNQYPNWDDCMRFYMSRIMNKVPQKSVLNDLAEAVEKIWKSGDGCPKSASSIMNQFEKTVHLEYKKYRKGDATTDKKKKKTEGPVQSPVRISKRSHAPLCITEEATGSANDTWGSSFSSLWSSS